MDFPLPMHSQANKASEAGLCARDQGKFWEMHDKIFENQRAIAEAELVKNAEVLGLDTKKSRNASTVESTLKR